MHRQAAGANRVRSQCVESGAGAANRLMGLAVPERLMVAQVVGGMAIRDGRGKTKNAGLLAGLGGCA